jgi:hypothetical protein
MAPTGNVDSSKMINKRSLAWHCCDIVSIQTPHIEIILNVACGHYKT